MNFGEIRRECLGLGALFLLRRAWFAHFFSVAFWPWGLLLRSQSPWTGGRRSPWCWRKTRPTGTSTRRGSDVSAGPLLLGTAGFEGFWLNDFSLVPGRACALCGV